MSKKIYPKSKVLETTVELAKLMGLEKLSIRAIARELGTSVSPVYDAFDSKEDIIKAVIIKILDENSSKTSYFNRNVDILEYGLNYPILYRDMQHYTRINHIETTHYEDVISLMKREKRLDQLDERILQSLNFDILIYISGLVQLSTSIKGPVYNNEYFVNSLSQATELLILGYEKAIEVDKL